MNGHTGRVLLSDLAKVTPDQLDELGISAPDALSTATIPLWRRSAKAKWHWADTRATCKHLPGNSYYGQSSTPVVPDELVPALGFSVGNGTICSGCQDQISLSASAEAFVAVAAELVRGRDWLTVGRDAASEATRSWLQFARWKNAQPLTGSMWDTTLRQIRGKQWATTALTLRGLVAEYRDDAEHVAQLYIDSIHENPARASQIERAVRMVETDSSALAESQLLLRIAGCCPPPRGEYRDPWTPMPDRPYLQRQPWAVVASTWKARCLDAEKPASVDDLCRYFDSEFPHVHDLAALGGCDEHTPTHEPGECLQSWAWRSAQAHRRHIVNLWLSRLDLALDGITSTNPHASATLTHLVCVPFWPPINDNLSTVAYLAQFPVVAGPFVTSEDYYDTFERRAVAVLRVPEWAAQHVEGLRRPLRAVTVQDDPLQAVALARAEGVPVMADEFTRRRKPSQLVQDARDSISAPHGGYGYRYHHRPLAPGAPPPHTAYAGERAWEPWTVRGELRRGSVFLYGTDSLELLHSASGHNFWCPEVTLSVELQTSCPRHSENEPHMCAIDGDVRSIDSDGTIHFRPQRLRESVAIPAAYIATLTFR